MASLTLFWTIAAGVLAWSLAVAFGSVVISRFSEYAVPGWIVVVTASLALAYGVTFSLLLPADSFGF